MSSASATDERETARWVRYHICAFFVLIGVAIGMIIVDARIAEIIDPKTGIVDPKAMSSFRTILLLSVLLAGLGARALLAWRSATVDLQGRIFLAVVGLALLTGAAFGLADCGQEVLERFRNPRKSPERARAGSATPLDFHNARGVATWA